MLVNTLVTHANTKGFGLTCLSGVRRNKTKHLFPSWLVCGRNQVYCVFCFDQITHKLVVCNWFGKELTVLFNIHTVIASLLLLAARWAEGLDYKVIKLVQLHHNTWDKICCTIVRYGRVGSQKFLMKHWILCWSLDCEMLLVANLLLNRYGTQIMDTAQMPRLNKNTCFTG